MEGKNVIEPDWFGDHPNAYFNYFYLIWYDFRYTKVLSKTVQSVIKPYSIHNQCTITLWMSWKRVVNRPQEVTSWFILIDHFFSTFWPWIELLDGLSPGWAWIDRGLIPHKSSLFYGTILDIIYPFLLEGWIWLIWGPSKYYF